MNIKTTHLFPVLLLLFLAGCGKKTTIEIGNAERRTIVSSVSVSGGIKPETEVPIAPDVSGEVIKIHVKEGDYVKAGQLLFEIRPDNFQAALDQAIAALNTARADFANAEAAVAQAESRLLQDSINAARAQGLLDRKAIAQAEYEQSRLAYELSKSALKSANQAKQAAFYRIENAKANVSQARESLRQTRVFATMDGTITKFTLRPGQRVVGTGMMAGTEVLTIADLQRMIVEVEINENDIVNIHLEDTATVEVDAFRGKKFKGKVIEIGFSPTNATSLTGATDDQVTSYPVKVLILPESYTNDPSLMKGLPEKASPFRPGMSGVVNIYTDRADDVVAVPIQAVTTGARGGASFGGGGERGGDSEGSGRKSGGGRRGEPTRIVYLYDAATKTVQTAEVTTGISDDAWLEIKSGLAPGQVIVTGPYAILTKELKDGMEVELEEKKGREGKGDRERGSKTDNAATTPATDPAKPTQPTDTTRKKRPEGTEGRPKSERSREQQ